MRINNGSYYLKVVNEEYSSFFLKRQFLGIVIVISFLLIACDGNKTEQDNCSQIHLTSSDLKESKSKKILLLVADDRSGSTQSRFQPARITENQYKILLQAFIERGYTGQFALRVIGNPSHTGFIETLTFDPIYDNKQIPDDATLTEKGKLRCLNKCIKDTCDWIQNHNQQKIEAYILKMILPAAIKYMPPPGQDITDIASALRDIEMRLKSSENADFDKTIVVIMSDGKDSNNSPNLTIGYTSPFELILIGWPEDKKVNDNYRNLDNVDGLINWFKNAKF